MSALASFRTATIYLVVALLLSLSVHHAMLARMATSDALRMGVPLASQRTDVSDNYAYFGLIKRGTSACRQRAPIDTLDASGNAIACTYVTAIAVSSALYHAGLAVSQSPRAAMAILMVLQTALVALSALVALQAIQRRRLTALEASLIGAGFLLLIDNFSVGFYIGSLDTDFRRVFGLEPNVTRLLNPTTFWALGLLALGAALHALQQASRAMLALAAMLLAFATSAGIATGAVLLGALLGTAFLDLLMRRRLHWRLLALCLAALLGMAWQYTQFRTYWASELGGQLQHGMPATPRFNPAFLLFLIPALTGRYGKFLSPADILVRLVILAAATIGSVSDSFELGARLWLRGTNVFALLGCLAWAWSMAGLVREWLSGIRGGLPALPRWIQASGAALVVMAFLAAMTVLRPFNPALAIGYIERDKAEVLDWLTNRTQPGDVVASPNLEDTFLIDFYTPATPFAGFYGMTALPWREPLVRYLSLLDQLQDGDRQVAALFAANAGTFSDYASFSNRPITEPYGYDAFQTVMFYDFMVYRAHNKEAQVVGSDGNLSPHFLDILRSSEAEAGQRQYDYDYLVLRAGEDLKSPQAFEEIHRNASYIVYAPAN